MFNKLISNLPFNPSLINQVAFYSRRLRQEASIRRLGFAFMTLAMAVQLFAVIAPPKPSLAQSTNDIIYGGIGTSNPKFGWFGAYNANTDQHNNDIRAIYDNFHVSVSDVQNSNFTTIDSGDHTLYSLGRNTGPSPSQNIPVDIPGSGTLYLRPLYVWGDHISYKALVGTRSDPPAGQSSYFAIMADCGNIVVKLSPNPSLAIVKHGLNHADDAIVKRNELLQYRVFFSNVGSGDAYNVVVRDGIPNNTTYVPPVGTGGADSIADHGTDPVPPFPGQAPARFIDWKYNVMPAGKENWYVDLNVRVNNDAPNGTRICNNAFIVASNNGAVAINKLICYTVDVPQPISIPVTPVNPSIPNITPVAPTTPTPSTPTSPVPQVGQPNISLNKLVSNLTRGINDANNTTANPKDILQYQVLTINTGSVTAPNYDKLDDNVNDILEYANITEISDNGVLKNGHIIWKPVDIKAGETLTRTFKIQVLDPIPSRPTSSSDPSSYDLRMDNTYGNLTSVKLPSPTVAKTAEVVTTTTIPNTGPGTTLLIGFGITVVIGYFFARSRLLATEVELITSEQTSGAI